MRSPYTVSRSLGIEINNFHFQFVFAIDFLFLSLFDHLFVSLPSHSKG